MAHSILPPSALKILNRGGRGGFAEDAEKDFNRKGRKGSAKYAKK